MMEGCARLRGSGSKAGFIAAAVFATVVFTLFALAAPAWAETFTVDNANNSGAGSLRQAITAANQNNEADTIEITATGTLQLQGALPEITTDMDISGPGAESFKVRREGGGDYRIFTVGSGATVEISGLTATNGAALGARGNDGSRDGSSSAGNGGNGRGGGISNAGTLTLTNMTVSGNIARGGDGGQGVQTFSSSGDPGAPGNAGHGGNGSGGGILNTGTLTLAGATVSGNTARGGDGGSMTGLGVGGDAGSGSGGGIRNEGTLTLTDTTISGNTAEGGGFRGSQGANGTGRGGGVSTQGGSATVESATVTANESAEAANLRADASYATIGNTIISNPRGGGGNCSSTNNAIASDGHNLEDADSCNFGQTSDKTGVSDPGLEPLSDNGGPTETHHLTPESPALDAGGSECPDTDQRGAARPQDGNADGDAECDIGALEVDTTPPPETTITAGPEDGSTISDTTPSFEFSSSEEGSTFACRVGDGEFAGCDSPFTTPELSEGSHTFEVRATDAAGNTDGTPASRTFTVDTTPPDDGGGDPSPSNPNTCTIVGTPGNDRLVGTPGRDVVCGPGNDRIFGGGGNDTVRGGPGNDRIFGGGGNDVIIGGGGNDILLGGAGADRLIGGPGRDRLLGQGGGDTLNARDGVRGNDIANGGPGRDRCVADLRDVRRSCP